MIKLLLLFLLSSVLAGKCTTREGMTYRRCEQLRKSGCKVQFVHKKTCPGKWHGCRKVINCRSFSLCRALCKRNRECKWDGANCIRKKTLQPVTTPTFKPTSEPTLLPTLNPTQSPTTKKPTQNPTVSPTTIEPTQNPTTLEPTQNPTRSPTTVKPTFNPSQSPTYDPTSLPTHMPSLSKSLL